MQMLQGHCASGEGELGAAKEKAHHPHKPKRSHGAAVIISISQMRRANGSVARRVGEVPWFLLPALRLALCPASRPGTRPGQQRFPVPLGRRAVRKSCSAGDCERSLRCF